MEIEYEVGDRFVITEAILKDDIDFDNDIPEGDRKAVLNFPVGKIEKILSNDEGYTHKISIEDMVFELNIEEIKTIKIVDKHLEGGDKIFITNSRSLYGVNKGEIFEVISIGDATIKLRNVLTDTMVETLVKFVYSDIFVIINPEFDVFTFPELIPDEVVNIDDNILIERYVDEDNELYIKIEVGDNLKKILQKGSVFKETREEVYNGMKYKRYLIKNYVSHKDRLKPLFEVNLVDMGKTIIKIDSAEVIERLKMDIESYLKVCFESIFKNQEKIVCEYKVRLVR